MAHTRAGKNRRGLARRAVALLAVAAMVAACSGEAAPSSSSSGAATQGAGADGGSVRFASTWQGDTDALRVVVEQFQESGSSVAINEVDGPTFSDQVSSYLQGTPDDIFTWFGGYRTRFYAEQGLLAPVTEVWNEIGDDYSEAYREMSTSKDGEQYLIPFYSYPWVVIYKQSVFEANGYEVPTTMDELLDLSAAMEQDGLVPFAFANQDGWPAMGWFDILNMRLNGYQFHIDLLSGQESWTDPRVAEVFETWRQFLPLYGNVTDALGQTWQDGANKLFNEEAGMLFFGTFAGTQADEETYADLAYFPFPLLGTEYDDEAAIDAPVNGFVVAAGSPSLEENREEVMEFATYLGSAEAQSTFLQENPNFVAASDAVDTTTYQPLQERAAEIIGDAGAISQFFDRETDPAFATEMEAFLQDWLSAPEQDLGAFLQGVQDFWDSLGIE
jgi:multiple sugar transport system substrate-binding protein